MSRIFVSGALYLGLIFSVTNGQNCAEDKVRKCIAIAEPMLKDPHLIFPDNMNDINNVCRTWSNFVDCIRRYIDKCFNKVRKDQFNTAVEPPIASVHQMCSISTYQSEYLQYAGCIKATVIEPEHCGAHYSVLVNEVSQENVRKANLCCAYHNFRSCVIQKTRQRCDSNQAEGVAAKFSRQVLDKAFRILQDQCLNYIPDTGKCASMMANSSAGMVSRASEGRSIEAPARKPPQPDVYRGKAGATDHYDTVTSGAQLDPRQPTNVDPRPSIGPQMPVTSGQYSSSAYNSQSGRQAKPGKVNDEPAAEEGPSRKTEPTHYTTIVENSVPIATQRSSSYGRGISWTTPTTPSTSEIPDWATNTWYTHGQDFPTEEIYPAAGSFGGNNIDEPNQQGLSRNAQITFSPAQLYIFISFVSAILLI